MLLDTSSFRSYGTSGMLIPLEDYPELIAACEEAGLSLDMGYVILEESHEKHLLGIPTDSLTGLNNLWIVTKGGYLTISASSDNYDESVQMIITMIHDMHP